MSALGTLLAVIARPGCWRCRRRAASAPRRARWCGGLLNVLRAVPELVWASLMLVAAGLGPFGGTLALAFHTSGVLGRLFADALENAEPLPQQTLRTNGAAPLAAFFYATLPQTLPQMLSYTCTAGRTISAPPPCWAWWAPAGWGRCSNITCRCSRCRTRPRVIIAMLAAGGAGRRHQLRAAPQPDPLTDTRAMLELRDLRKSYDGRPVLRGLSHLFAAGEFVAIMGESGVGKSTLLNLIAGLDAPDGGAVVVDGQTMAALDDDAATRLRRTRMGFIFQAFHVLPHLTLAQNVALPLLLNRQGDKGLARAAEMLDAVGLDGRGARLSRASCPAANCSGWRSPAPWCTALPWCWPTNRPATSIPRRPTASCPAAPRNQGHSGACAIMVTHSHAAAAQADKILVLSHSGLEILPNN